MNEALIANLLAWLNRAVIFGAIIMYGAMGETLTQKSGNMNLGHRVPCVSAVPADL